MEPTRPKTAAPRLIAHVSPADAHSVNDVDLDVLPLAVSTGGGRSPVYVADHRGASKPAVDRSPPFSRRPVVQMRGGWWLQLAPLGIPVAVLAVGAVYACENCSPSALGQGVRHPWAGHVVDALLLLQLVGAIWLVRLALGRRFISSVVQALQLWCAFWAAVLAGMSISGDWL